MLHPTNFATGPWETATAATSQNGCWMHGTSQSNQTSAESQHCLLNPWAINVRLISAKIRIFPKHQMEISPASQLIVATFRRVTNLRSRGDVMLEQRPIPQDRQSIAVAAFYATSAAVVTLGIGDPHHERHHRLHNRTVVAIRKGKALAMATASPNNGLSNPNPNLLNGTPFTIAPRRTRLMQDLASRLKRRRTRLSDSNREYTNPFSCETYARDQVSVTNVFSRCRDCSHFWGLDTM
jgi:hypothetical protein